MLNHPEPEPFDVAIDPGPIITDAGIKLGPLGPFSFSWRLDGVITISKYGEQVMLTLDEAAKVRRFLDRLDGMVL